MLSKFRVIGCFLLLIMVGQTGHSQSLFDWFTGNKANKPTSMLLNNREIQIQTTDAINDMYNFRFFEAERGFKWLTIKYPDHPIGYFLIGLNTWWRIVPDTKVQIYDAKCHEYMDQSIDKAEDMLDIKEVQKEAAFFMACAYAFKGRLYAERENWIKSAWAGKQALKYMERSRGDETTGPELIFGEGIYNYYSKWIHETYPSLKPLLVFFRKGNKPKGIEQLDYVSKNAFYTRMEARYFLLQIYAMEGKNRDGLMLARMMHSLYPANPFFHRYAARFAFTMGQLPEAERYANELLDRIDKNFYGYGNNDGRYASYILAYVNRHQYKNLEKAKLYYERTIGYATNNDMKDSGYFLASHLELGKMAEAEGNLTEAENHYKEVAENAERKSEQRAEAANLLKGLKGKRKQQKRA